MQGSRVKSHAPFWSVWMVFLFTSAVSLLLPVIVQAQDSDCAEVKIVIEQKLSLERQAFDAHLLIRNGLDEDISNIRVDLIYLDQDQQPVLATTDPNSSNATFFQRLDRMAGLNSLDGDGMLAGRTTADIHWLLIPAQGAGGDEAGGRMYYVGAKVTYTLAGETTTVEVVPDYIVVQPQPKLVLDYFLPTDVHADDPFTPELEPSEPFTLGVRVVNVGAGTSVKTTIDSAQPKIVENHQGLLVDFTILGGYVGNDPFGKSLMLNFGDIKGHSAKVGRWIMETTLAGQFTEFDASFTHADSLGGAVTSLIESVTAHKLVHDVLVDLPGHDDVYDFLAEYGNGYKVYDSQGGDSDVADVSSQSSLIQQAGKQLLSFPSAPSLVHAKVSDPFGGARSISRVVRSDGKSLPAQNFWLSKTHNSDLSWSYFVHVFDSDSTGEYILEFSESTDASLSGMAYHDINGNGVQDLGEDAEGNLPILLTGTDVDGRRVVLQTHTDSLGMFVFAGLTPGRYQLLNIPEDGTSYHWIIGSAGGVLQEQGIEGIELTPGMVADRYRVGRYHDYILPDDGPDDETQEQKTDLSVSISATQTNLLAGDTTKIRIKVHNRGSVARDVFVNLPVPDGLTLHSSDPGLGSFAAGRWMLGELADGADATLALTIEADEIDGNEDKHINWTVHVASETPDLDPSNNSAQLGLLVRAEQEWPFTVALSLLDEARVLVLSSCAAVAGDCTTQAADAEAVIGSHVVALQVVDDAQDWLAAWRSGSFNVAWVHGSAAALDDQMLSELRAAIYRGASLVVDIHGESGIDVRQEAAISKLADILGARAGARLSVTVDEATAVEQQPNSGHVPGAIHTVIPEARAIKLVNSGGNTVAVRTEYGLGASMLLGFDLLAAGADGAASSGYWTVFADQQLTSLLPRTDAQALLVGNTIGIEAEVKMLDDADPATQQATLHLGLPVDSLHSDVAPTASSDGPHVLEWRWTFAAGTSQKASLRLMPSQAQGIYTLMAQLFDDAQKQLATDESIDLRVLNVSEAIAEIASILNDAQASASEAAKQFEQARQLHGEDDLAGSLEHLALMQAALPDLALPPDEEHLIHLAVARWIALDGRQLQGGTDPDGNGGTTTPATLQLLALAGDHQAAENGQLFAQPLSVQLLDAQGQPVSGQLLEFAFDNTGASGIFVDGSYSARVFTDTSGKASSPSFIANGIAGRYQALVKLTDSELAPLEFNLENKAHKDRGAVFQAPTATGTGTVRVTFTGGGPSCVFNPLATRADPAEGIWTPLLKFLLPHGLLTFELIGCEPGSEVTIQTEWPNLQGITGYLKYGPTPWLKTQSSWYAPMDLHINGNTVTYTIRDGGLGDDDLTANGIIGDPGGPVTGDPTPDPTPGGGDSDGNISPIPTLGQGALAGLMVLMLVFGLRHSGLRRDRHGL